MRRRLREAWVGRLLTDPTTGRARRLRGLVRWGSPRLQIRALRELIRREAEWAVELAAERCADPAPGVRRTAGQLVGLLGAGEHCDMLTKRAQVERSDEVRMALAVAAVRQGLPVSDGWSLIEQASRRPVATCYGKRNLAAAVGVGTTERALRWAQAISPFDKSEEPSRLQLQPWREARAELRAVLEQEPENREALVALGAQQHPDDHWLIRSQLRHGGRRSAHATTIALGLNGDPRAIEDLIGVLQALDVDPGHGFQGRRLAGNALGQLGIPEIGRFLVRALEAEALDFEGRPGAGLGIQFPVRSTLLYALGESGDQSAVEELLGYLANTHGSALGGFHLPAMDALIKLGARAETERLLAGPELIAANALGVLGGLEARTVVAQFLDDPRPRVAAAAGCVVELLGPPHPAP